MSTEIAAKIRNQFARDLTKGARSSIESDALLRVLDQSIIAVLIREQANGNFAESTKSKMHSR
jgi:hypothetical protein